MTGFRFPVVVRRSLLGLACLGLLVSAVGYSADPKNVEEADIKLPTFELVRKDVPPAQTRVGDAVPMGLVGDATLRVDLQSGGADTDLEWYFEPVPGSEFRFNAVPLKTGTLNLPSLKVQDSSGKVVGKTVPLPIQVQSGIAPSDPQPQAPAPPEPPIGLGFPWQFTLFAFLLALLVFGVLVFFAVRYFSKIKRKPAVVPEVPPLPEDEEALQELLRIEKEQLVAKGQYKAFSFRVSEVMKKYLGRRFRFDALECTSTELMVLLEQRRTVRDESLDDLEKLFSLLDRVKFTDHTPPAEETAQMFTLARELVQRTRRPVAVVPGASQAPAQENHANQ